MPTFQNLATSLNGWQRAWLLLAAVGLVGVLACAYQTFPTLERQRGRVYEVSAHRSVEINAAREEAMQNCFKLLQTRDAAAFPECSRIATEAEIHRNRQRAEARDSALATVEEQALSAQVFWIARVGGTWLISSLGLYALGVAIGWVRNGFKRDA